MGEFRNGGKGEILTPHVCKYRICEFWICFISKTNMLSRAKTLSVPCHLEWLPVEFKWSSYHYSCHSSDEFENEFQSKSNKEECKPCAKTKGCFRPCCTFRYGIVYDVEIS